MKPKISFELKKVTVSLDCLLPVRQLADSHKTAVRYSKILSSIKEVGVVEPLIVYPQKNKSGSYLLINGHLRYYALKELGINEVDCVVSTEDESFTYNARVNRLAPIQEHRMIVKAVRSGVPIERIAAALNMKTQDIVARMNMLDGIDSEAIDLLKDKDISASTLKVFRKVTKERQVDMAELMEKANDFTEGYAEAILLATPKDQLVAPDKPKITGKLSAEELARMEHEMETLERDFKGIEDSYAENMFNLTVIRTFMKKLLDNNKVVRFLSAKHAELFAEFERIATTEPLA